MADTEKLKKTPKLRSSIARHYCSVTAEHFDVPLYPVPDGHFERADGAENDLGDDKEEETATAALPLGWGRITLETLAPNPEVAKVKAERQEMINQQLATILETLRALDYENPDMTGEQRAVAKDNWDRATEEQKEAAEEMRKHVQTGAAATEVREEVCTLIPLPDDEEVLMRATFHTLSPTAFNAAVEALRAAGFPLQVLS